MAQIPSAKVSPRIENNNLCWYAGDTFSLEIEIDIRLEDGTRINLQDGDQVIVTYYDSRDTVVATETITTFSSNKITITMDATKTAKFPAGKYKYDIVHVRSWRRTIAKKNPIIVE